MTLDPVAREGRGGNRMMEASAFDSYTNELCRKLEINPDVRGLILLGSTADPSARDKWSDHDFWIVTEPGCQHKYLDEFTWLPQASELAFVIRHGPNRANVLYDSGHRIEYAVFDPHEARTGTIERFRVILDRGGVQAIAQQVQDRSLAERASALRKPDRLLNLCSLVWTAVGYWERGELLTARRYAEGFAVDEFLNLHLSLSGSSSAGQDRLDGRRRLEQNVPAVAAHLNALLGRPVPEVALGILELAELELKAQSSTLGWEHVQAVRGWIRALAP